MGSAHARPDSRQRHSYDHAQILCQAPAARYMPAARGIRSAFYIGG